MYRNQIGIEEYAWLAYACGLLLAQTLIDALVVGWYWYWFGVTALGLPPMTYLTTVGIMVGLRFAINGFGDSGGAREDSPPELNSGKIVFRLFFVPPGFWLFGFILTLFAG